MTIASASDDRITVVTADKGQKGTTGTAGLDGQGFNGIRQSLLDSPLCRLFTPNNIAHTLAGSLTATRASSATYVDRYGVVKTAAIDEMREESKGWLIEGASTNLVLQSEAIDTFTTLGSPSVTANAGMSPDGNITADNVAETPVLDSFGVSTQFSAVSGQSYTFSVFARANGRNNVHLILGGVFGSNYASFNVLNGTVNNLVNCSGSIIDLGTGWFRCSITATATASSTVSAVVYLADSSSAPQVPIYNGSTLGVRLWGAQVESLPLMSSYIPTSGVSATRAADLIMAQGENNSPKPSQSSTVSATFSPIGFNSFNRMWTYGTGDLPSEAARIGFNENAQVFYSNGDLSNGFGQQASDFGDSSHITLTFDGLQASCYVDGIGDNDNPIAVSNASELVPDKVTLGQNYAQSGNFLFGHIRDFRIYDFAINADEAQYLAGVK